MNTRAVVYKADTGEILFVSSCLIGEVEAQAPEGSGLSAIEHATAGPDTHKVVNGEVIEYSIGGKFRKKNIPDSHEIVWNPAVEDWVDQRPLNSVRADKLRELKLIRDQLLEGGFVWDNSTFDSDIAVSQPRLLGLFTSAVNGLLPPGGQPWRLKDNSWRTLSAADAIAVWGAFQMRMAALFQAFGVHEATVNAETDINVLRSYDTHAGWPT